MPRINDEEEMNGALRSARTVAVVGCSPNPARPSNSIARYLDSAGYEVIPVNPGHQEILGKRCYHDLASIPKEVRVDIVDVFRRSEHVGEVAEQAVARGVGYFWMQDGVVNQEAAKKLVDAGIGVVMDDCIYRRHRTLGK